MIQYPNIDPVIFKITDSLQIRWYGMMYVIAFILCWFLLKLRSKRMPVWQQQDILSDLFFYCALGVLIGGRLGYILFYNLPALIEAPLSVLKVWEGGMSFHGGLLGVAIAVWLFTRKYKMRFLDVGDMIAPVIPLGLGLGRLGNFINGELWGKVTDVPWAMVFPMAGSQPRHPSQLYAVALEGILLFIIVWVYAGKPRRIGQVSGCFLLGYGLVRSFEEFFREPDRQYGYLAFDWLTMGHLLCLPMILIGAYLMVGHCCKKTIGESA